MSTSKPWWADRARESGTVVWTEQDGWLDNYTMQCDTCGTIGTEDDLIEVGGECAHEWCDGTIVAVQS